MKKILTALIVITAIVMFTLIGCAPALQMGASLIGEGLGNSLGNNTPTSNLILGTETERHNVGKYEVGVSGGFYKNDPGIIFMAYDQGRRTKAVYFEKKNPDDMKMLNNFNQMGEAEKRQQIREWFLKYSKFNLGPIESETAEKSPAPSQNIPTPGFAPAPLPR